MLFEREEDLRHLRARIRRELSTGRREPAGRRSPQGSDALGARRLTSPSSTVPARRRPGRMRARREGGHRPHRRGARCGGSTLRDGVRRGTGRSAGSARRRPKAKSVGQTRAPDALSPPVVRARPDTGRPREPPTHPTGRRLLRPFPSTTPFHPPLYEGKGRSEGRRDAVERKERSRRSGVARPIGAVPAEQHKQ